MGIKYLYPLLEPGKRFHSELAVLCIMDHTRKVGCIPIKLVEFYWHPPAERLAHGALVLGDCWREGE